jgi:ParB/Sulfiredoxin domain
MTTEQITDYPVTLINVADVKEDTNNPNTMTEERMEGLKTSIRKFGNVVPITVNEDMLIADGWHRVLAYREMGEEKIPAYIVPALNDDIQRRLFRQTLNKLRGVHDPELDFQELSLLMDNDQSKSELLGLLQFDNSSLNELEYLVETNRRTSDVSDAIGNRAQDGDPTMHHANSFLYGNIKQITAFFDNETYQQMIEMSQDIMERLDIDNHTDLFWSMLNHMHAKNITFDVMHVEPPERQDEVKLTYRE